MKLPFRRAPQNQPATQAVGSAKNGKQMVDTKQFYDDLASYYHLIFENWDESMARQGDALLQLIDLELERINAGPVRVLDAACGIGTQALPLATRGFQVTARDLSPAAVSRLQREAQVRHVIIDAAVSDMRQVASSVSGSFDVVLAFDNSVSHLLDDKDVTAAFQQFFSVLRPGGVFLCSVRDYDRVQRGEPATHLYGRREYGGETFHLRQEWSWDDPMHYQGTIIIDRETPNGLTRELCTASRFYAVSIGRLLELMRESSLQDCRRIDETMYQPILIGRRVA
jgi:SAM-dependent methyltransferase